LPWSFPVTFNNTCLLATANIQSAGNVYGVIIYLQSVTSSGCTFTASNSTASTQTVDNLYLFAIGY
jgi:hypothetical protein